MDPAILGSLAVAFTIVTNLITWFVANRAKITPVIDDVKALAVDDPKRNNVIEMADELRKLLSDVGALVSVLNEHGIPIPAPKPVAAPPIGPGSPLTVAIESGPIADAVRSYLDSRNATARI